MQKLIDASFPEVFASCLSDDKWLPFTVPLQFKVQPSLQCQGEEIQATLQCGGSFDFCFSLANGGPFGRLCVAPVCTEFSKGECITRTDCFTVTQFNPRYSGATLDKTVTGLGRETLRRAVYFADEYNFELFKFIVRVPQLSSFLLAHGFRSSFPLAPRWGSRNLSRKFIEAWNTKIRENPDSAWRFARTKIGRDVFKGVSGSMTLNLRDPVQRGFAFRRLKLPLETINAR